MRASKLLSFLLGCLLAVVSRAQTSMTFQGQLLVAGAPASGTYDLRFTLYNAATGGAAVSTPACADNVSITNGLCNVILPFTFPSSGADTYIEVQVRTNAALPCSDSTGFTTLSPRQRLTPAPAAVFASAVPQNVPTVPGAIRFNPAMRKFEGYDGAYWSPFTMDAPILPTFQLFDTPGQFDFTVPANVTRLGIDIFGGAGGGGARGPGIINPSTCNTGQGGYAASGGGGSAGSAGRFSIDVTPGEVITVYVGFGGLAGTSGDGGSGTASRIRRAGNTIEVITAPAGAGGLHPTTTVTMGGGTVCAPGGGGNGGGQTPAPTLLGSGTVVIAANGNSGFVGRIPGCNGTQICNPPGGAGGTPAQLGAPLNTFGATGGNGGGSSTAAQPGEAGRVVLW